MNGLIELKELIQKLCKNDERVLASLAFYKNHMCQANWSSLVDVVQQEATEKDQEILTTIKANYGGPLDGISTRQYAKLRIELNDGQKGYLVRAVDGIPQPGEFIESASVREDMKVLDGSCLIYHKTLKKILDIKLLDA